MNRQEFAGSTPADAKIINSPNLVKFSILQTKDFENEYLVPFRHWGGQYKKEIITRYRIRIYSGELYYPRRDVPFTSDTPEDIWVGKKWVDKRLRDRENRLEKRRKSGKSL